jgi:hypothetical protein
MSDPRMQVVTQEVPTIVQIVEDHARFEVVVNETQIEVVSVGIQGPIGPQGPTGPQGPAGGVSTASSPLEVSNGQVALASGTVSGQGLIWSGTAWAPRAVIPTGTGTVPYTTAQGLGGDSSNLRYEPSEQALYVTRINNASVDGGNF